jgi:hypothetical protein
VINQEVYIFSPSLDQSKTIAKYLRNYFPRINIIGVFLEGEHISRRNNLYDKTISIEQFERYGKYHTIIPTGAKSTKYIPLLTWGYKKDKNTTQWFKRVYEEDIEVKFMLLK